MNYFDTHIRCSHQRIDGPAPNWLITVSVTTEHAIAAGAAGSYPQARAVMDDFGTLVIVRGWL